MEDKRAHERITNLEIAIAENTVLTKKIAENTSELVMLVKGAKGIRTFVVWASPLVAVAVAIWAIFLATFSLFPQLLHWLKGH